LNLGHGLSLNSTAYWIHEYGPATGLNTIPEVGGYQGSATYGNLGLPYATNGRYTTEVVDPWRQDMSGINASLVWETAHNRVTAGWWYSYATHAEWQRFSLIDYSGNVNNINGQYPIKLPGDMILSGFNLNFKQQINMGYIEDAVRLFDDRLLLRAGFKAAMVGRAATDSAAGAEPYKNGSSSFEPMPQVAVSYKLSSKDQLFINGTTAFRTRTNPESYFGYLTPNSPTPTSTPAALKDEYSIGEEIGYRHHGLYNVSVSAFNYNLTNHQLSSEGYLPGSTQLVYTSINAGGQTARGVQVELGLGWWNHFSPYVSAQYLHATTDNNFNAGVDYLPTKGKTAVTSPKFTAAVGLNYDNGSFFGDFNLKYVGKQYTTLMDDESIPSYVVSNLTLGYRLTKIRSLKNPQIQLNLVNLGDNNYLSGPQSFSASAKTRTGIFGNTVQGSSPVYLVGAGFAALVTVATSL